MAYAAKTKWIQCPAAVVVVKDVTNNITTTLPTISAAYRVSKGNKGVKVLDAAAEGVQAFAGGAGRHGS